MSNGKGDSPRPLSVDRDTFHNNWDRIFSTVESEHDTPERSDDNTRELPRIDEDGNRIEWTAC